MFIKPLTCPNPKCAKTGDFYTKSGYFKTKHDHQPNPKYLCRFCGMTFSSHSDRANKYQKKPQMNAQIFKWVCSGVTLNRIAKNLGIHRRTVVRKIDWLAKQAERAHGEAILSGDLKATLVQLDEMETFEHTRLKPLSVAIVVSPDSGKIIDMRVATMAAKGHNAASSLAKYGPRPDTRAEALKSAITTLCGANGGEVDHHVTIECDSKSGYPNVIHSVLPKANVKAVVVSSKKKPKGSFDPLFAVNNLIASMRADLAPLARKSWTTTKSPESLQNLLFIYIAWVNGYDICANTNRAATKTKARKLKAA